MIKRIIPLTFSLFIALTTFAQIPRNIQTVVPLGHHHTSAARMPCGQNDAGDVAIGNINGMSSSNPATDTPIFLCFGDEFLVTHFGGSLNGDPDSSTQAGYGYAFYDRIPTVEGPDLDSILADPGIIPSPTNPNSPLVYVDNPNGDAVFQNGLNIGGQSLPDFFNDGEPIQLWFAPITYDALDNTTLEAIYEGIPNPGACVSVSTDQAFSVVYLNPIAIATNNGTINYPFAGNTCEARLSLQGGLPEFDPAERYNVTVVNKDDPSIIGTIQPTGSANVIDFNVPQAGIYEIIVSDGIGCELSLELDMSTCSDETIILESAGGTYGVGQEFCVDITVRDFNNIVGFNFSLNWDTAVLDFTRLEYYNNTTFLDGSSIGINDEYPGFINILYLDFGLVPTDLDDGSILFAICFTGKREGNAMVKFVNDPQFPDNGPAIEFLADIDGDTRTVRHTSDEGLITIIDPDGINTIIETVQDACAGQDNGSFDVRILGGTAPYEIVWVDENDIVDGPLTIENEGEVVTIPPDKSLAPGVYQLQITDAGGVDMKFDFDSVEIVEVNLVADAGVASPVTCNGFSDGSMGVDVYENGNLLNDVSDFSFVWQDGNNDTVSTEEIATDLSTDSYTVFVINSNGCTASNTSILPQTNPLDPALGVVQPSCSGVEDGSISINNVDGGRPPFEYAWSNNITGNTNLNIAEGKYIYTITDDNGCELVDSTQLTATITVNTNPLAEPVQCFGQSDGSIALTATVSGVSAGNIPAPTGYVFEWSPNAPIQMETGARSIQSGLEGGIYDVTITHPDLPVGCQATESFMITEPDSIIIGIDITNVTSCTASDGAATVTVEGGTISADYLYAWEIPNTPVQNTAAVTNLGPDSISIMVNDDNGCMAQLDTVVGTPPPPQILGFNGKDSLDCDSDFDGVLTVDAIRGDAPIAGYKWSHDPNLNQPLAGSLGPGVYYVQVIDEDQCSTIDSAVVYAPPALAVDTSIFTNPCFGAEDGRISLSVEGGTPGTNTQPYQYAWPGGSTGSVLSGIASGTYEATITDANDCQLVVPLTLENLPRIMVNFTAIDSVSCFDNTNLICDGGATAAAVYEDGSTGSFEFTWSTGEVASGTDQTTTSSLCGGMQSLFVSDGICSITDSLSVPSPPQLLYDPVGSSVDPVSCFGVDDGMATVQATGGTPGYVFNWSTQATGATVSNLGGGTYTVSITDRNNCLTTHDIQITEPALLSVGIDLDNTNNVVCAGDNDGKIEVVYMGGNQGPVSYNWTNNVSNGPAAAGLSPGLYTIEVTDVNGCTGSTDYQIEEPPALLVDIGPSAPIQCHGFQTTIVANAVQGGNGPAYTFSVDNSPAQPLDVVIPVFGGDHQISVFDSRGCRLDTILTIAEPEEVTVSFPESFVEVDLGNEVTLMPEISGSLGVPIVDVEWTVTGGTDSSFVCTSVLCDNITVFSLDDAIYNITATDQNGCSASNSIQLKVDKNRNVYIPNAFAPNGRGFDTNDKFKIYTGSGVAKINYARVFNRWGTMVSNLNDLAPSNSGVIIWDGKIKGQRANQGVYIYIVEVEFIDRQPDGSPTTLLYRGDVTLFR